MLGGNAARITTMPSPIGVDRDGSVVVVTLESWISRARAIATAGLLRTAETEFWERNRFYGRAIDLPTGTPKRPNKPNNSDRLLHRNRVCHRLVRQAHRYTVDGCELHPGT